MKSLANWITVIFMVAYWIFRIVVTYMAATGVEFIAQPINYKYEIGLLFITLVCILLVINRKAIGGIIYCISYVGYFGVDLFNQIMPMIKGENFNIDLGTSIVMSAMGVILSIAVMIDVLSDKVRTPKAKETDWFYDNKNLDRKLDERADKNNYKLL